MLRILYKLGVRYPKTVLFFSLLLIGLSFWAARNLRIENNLTALLPQEFESVQALKSMEEAFGGLGFLVVVVEGPDAQKTESFADQLVEQVRQVPEVAFVDYKRPIEYFRKRQWLFVSLEDLQEMEARLDRSLELQKLGVSPIFNDFMDFADEEDRPDLTYEDVQKKYEKKYGFDLGSESAALTTTDEGKFITFRVKTRAHQQDLDQGHRVISAITESAHSLQQRPEFSQIKISFSGDHVGAIETVDFLRRRMTLVSLAVITLLIVILWAYLRRPSAVFFVGFPLFSGILWTGGIIELTLGHLNIITGFAAGILAGLGSDYGIYMVSRFFQERGAGRSFGEACELAFYQTGRAGFGSMLTTVFAFLALLLSEFGVTVEFGIVGAVGLFMNFLAMMLVLPALLTLREQWLLKRKKDLKAAWSLYGLHDRMEHSKVFQKLFMPRAKRAVVLATVLLGLVSALTVPSQGVIHFEDGRMDSLGLPSEKLFHKVAHLYGGTLQPTMLLVQGMEENKKVVKAFEEVLAENTENKTQNKNSKNTAKENLPFKQVLGLSSFLPEHQKAKRQIISRLAEKFSLSNFPVKKKREEMIESFRDSVQASRVTLSELPQEVKRMFISPFQKGVTATFLFPQWDELDWNWMKRYSDTVLGIREQQGLKFQAVDNPFVAAEFVRMIQHEAPKMVGFTALFILATLLWTTRPFSRALLIFAHLGWGILLLSGVMYLFHIELNTLNIAAFPIILGTGIDCFIHFGLRFDETRDMDRTIREKLPTILISNLTTVIGFAGLLFIPSAGLRSLGWTALIGLILMTTLCAVVFPRVLTMKTLADSKT